MDLIIRPAQGREPARAFARIAVPGLCRLERPSVDTFSVCRMDGMREDLWREMLAERDRDAAAERLAAETSRMMAALLRHEEAEVPWEWAERALMIAGVIISGWVARGGLMRLWRRVRGQPVTPAPEVPMPEASAPKMEGGWV